jgi:periplasmic divalent cation tolerance protein
MATEIAVVLMTAPDAELAASLGARLVEERLAACATVFADVTSVYRWQGAMQHEPEAQVLLKTRRELVAALMRRAAELHPYEVPELISFPATASAGYAAWVNEVTGQGDGEGL